MSNKHINQDHLAVLGIPPSRTNAEITLPIASAQQITTNLNRLGLTADDLKPIDWRKKADLSSVKNQANCGDCWAQSSTSALTDRFIIHKGIKNLDLSALLTTQCVPETLNRGCGGGSTTAAGTFFEQTGAVDSSDGCPSWADFCTAQNGCGQGLNCNGVSCAVSASQPGCKQDCTPQVPTCQQITTECSKNKYIYKAKQGSTRSTAADTAQATITNMKHELMGGPYPVCYLVPKDFMAPQVGYKWEKTNGIYINGEYNDELHSRASDVYKKALHVSKPSDWADIIIEGYSASGGDPQPMPAAHAVELVGWDIGFAGPKYGRIPYWIVKNSWGENWNDHGYFYIAMNDPDSSHPGLNAHLGLDVPISQFVEISTGKVLSRFSSQLGSGTVFDPDLSSGGPTNHEYKPKHGSKSKKVKWKWIIGGVVLLIIAIVVIYFLTKKHKKKRGRKKK